MYPILAVAMSFAQISRASIVADGVELPHVSTSFDVQNCSLRDALIALFSGAGLVCRFEPLAEKLTMSIRRTIHCHSLPFDDLVTQLAVSYDHRTLPVFTVSRDAHAYVINLPRVTSKMGNTTGTVALANLLDQLGMNWCADVSNFTEPQVSFEFTKVPFERAFGELMSKLKPTRPMELGFVNGCCVVTPAGGASSTYSNISHRIMARFKVASTEDAIAALFLCIHGNYRIDVSGGLTGTISNSAVPAAFKTLLLEIMGAEAHGITVIEDNGIFAFIRIPSGTPVHIRKPATPRQAKQPLPRAAYIRLGRSAGTT